MQISTTDGDSPDALPLGLPKASLKVAVIPPWAGLENNALFESRWLVQGPHSPNTHWLDCFAAILKAGKAKNIVFGTADVIPTIDADVLIYMRQPDSPNDVIKHKLRHPSQKTILLMYETSLGARYASNPQNHRGYDAVFTYVKRLVDGKRYFYLPPRAF